MRPSLDTKRSDLPTNTKSCIRNPGLLTFIMNSIAILLLALSAFGSVDAHSHGDEQRELKGQPFWVGSKKFNSKAEFETSGARCGQRVPSDDEVVKTRDIVKAWVEAKKNGKSRRDLQSTFPVLIETHFHIIRPTSGNQGTIVPSESIDVINDAFAPHGFQFNLVATTYSYNTAWYGAGPDTAAEADMKNSLRVAGDGTLNIYASSPGGGLLGWATFPTNNIGFDDGVVILDDTVPGGSSAPYNEGDTLTHEVGKYHT